MDRIETKKKKVIERQKKTEIYEDFQFIKYVRNI